MHVKILFLFDLRRDRRGNEFNKKNVNSVLLKQVRSLRDAYKV